MTFRKLIVIIATFSGLNFQSSIFAQFRPSGEIGAGIGGSSYLGELNKIPFNYPNISANIFYRHNFDCRYSVKTKINAGIINAKGIGYDTVPMQFSTKFADFNFLTEYNFLRYLPANKKYKISPYVTAGIGVMYFNADRQRFVFSIPFGMGLKYTLKNNFIIGADCILNKTFCDFVDFNVLQSKTLSHHKQMSYASNTDWYTVYSINISYKIKYRQKCPTFD